MPSRDVIEVVRPRFSRGRFRAAVFDFDGTLSLLRDGWQSVMTGTMLAELRQIAPGESEARLAAIVEEIVIGLNGRPTIVQMQALAAEVARRGGRPAEPADYSAQYQEKLSRLIRGRYEDIASGRVSPSAWAVPGTHAWLSELRERGLILVLVSGTKASHVAREADILGLTDYFGEAVFSPAGNDPDFSKRLVIEQLLCDLGLHGEELIGFGDGVVETEDVRRVGGVAIGVAGEEPPRRGVNSAKRERLIRAGADVVIADYECHQDLLRWMDAEG
jgi:phosphoglycolate phosphatase-like HAD superfamily hydrolase